MKKSVKVTALMAAAATVCALSAAVGAEVYNNSGVYYDNITTASAPATNTSGVYYDNTTSAPNSGVYYDSTSSQGSSVNNSGVYYDTNAGSVNTNSGTVYYDNYTYPTSSLVTVYPETSVLYYDQVIARNPNVSVETDQLKVSYTRLKSAEKAAGIAFDDLPSNVVYDLRSKKHSVVDSNILQVKYYDNSGDAVAVRKGFGKADVSGDRTRYDVNKTVRIDGTTVSFSGYKYTAGRTTANYYHLATWNRDGYSYSIKTNIPMTLSEIQSIAEDMIWE